MIINDTTMTEHFFIVFVQIIPLGRGLHLREGLKNTPTLSRIFFLRGGGADYLTEYFV